MGDSPCNLPSTAGIHSSPVVLPGLILGFVGRVNQEKRQPSSYPRYPTAYSKNLRTPALRRLPRSHPCWEVKPLRRPSRDRCQIVLVGFVRSHAVWRGKIYSPSKSLSTASRSSSLSSPSSSTIASMSTNRFISVMTRLASEIKYELVRS